MKILGIECSGQAASCAVTQEGFLLGEATLNDGMTHSQKLMPLIVQLLENLNINLLDIQHIAINHGPGSYTGLRIGAAIMKGLTFDKATQVVGIHSTRALAYNLKWANSLIVPMIDARSTRAFTALYQSDQKELYEVMPPHLKEVEEIIEELEKMGKPFVLLGDGARKHGEVMIKALSTKGVQGILSNPLDDVIKASTLCILGEQMITNGFGTDPSLFEPYYLRDSQAERQKNE